MSICYFKKCFVDHSFVKANFGASRTLRPAIRRTIALIATIAGIMMISPFSRANAQTVMIARNHPIAAASLTGRAAADQPLTITISLTLRDNAKLNALLAAQQDPQSRQFHKWLTSAEFDARFGRTKSEVRALSNWLTSDGFKVTATSSRQITAEGTAAIAEAAFHTTIAASEDGTVFANTTDPEIPASLDGLIGAIDGLDNTRHAVPLSHQAPALANPVLAPALALDTGI
jgi:subtilase family serine protease